MIPAFHGIPSVVDVQASKGRLDSDVASVIVDRQIPELDLRITVISDTIPILIIKRPLVECGFVIDIHSVVKDELLVIIPSQIS